jgi:hypothetical protein
MTITSPETDPDPDVTVPAARGDVTYAFAAVTA